MDTNKDIQFESGEYFRKEMIDGDTGERYYQTKTKAKNGFYEITNIYGNEMSETLLVKCD